MGRHQRYHAPGCASLGRGSEILRKATSPLTYEPESAHLPRELVQASLHLAIFHSLPHQPLRLRHFLRHPLRRPALPRCPCHQCHHLRRHRHLRHPSRRTHTPPPRLLWYRSHRPRSLLLHQLLVRALPQSLGIRGTLIDALCSSPLASPCSEMVESDCEWCVIPVRLY